METIDDEILQMHNMGITPAVMAEELELSLPTIYKAHQRLKLIPHRKTAPKATKETLQTAIERYQDDDSVQDICAELEISYNALYKALRDANIKLRRSEQYKDARRERLDKAIEMYQNDYKIKDIVIETGVHQPAIHMELRKRQIPLRRERIQAQGVGGSQAGATS